VLWLGDTKVTNEGLSTLGEISSLKELSLCLTSITDEGLANLEYLQLEEFNIGKTTITDAGIIHIQKIKTLRILNLSHTKVTDSILPHLEGMPNLKWVGLGNTQVTQKAVNEARTRNPSLKIGMR